MANLCSVKNAADENENADHTATASDYADDQPINPKDSDQEQNALGSVKQESQKQLELQETWGNEPEVVLSKKESAPITNQNDEWGAAQ